MLDRLRDLRRDREQQVDLAGREVPRRPGADVERAGKLLPGQDRTARIDSYSSSGRFWNALKRGSRCAFSAIITGSRAAAARAGDPLARPHTRPARHLLDAGAVRRAQDELVRALVVQVDEAGVGLERSRDLARDQREHLLEVERRVDRLDRLGQEPEVALSGVHGTDYRRPPVSTYDWLLFLHVIGAFLLAGGTVVAGALHLAAHSARAPSEIALLLGLTRFAVVASGSALS